MFVSSSYHTDMTQEELTIVQEDYIKHRTEVCHLCRGLYNPQVKVIEESTRWNPQDAILVCSHCYRETYPDDQTLEEFESWYYEDSII